MSIHSERVFTAWVVGVLEAGGLNVGQSERPATYDPTASYIVVHSIAGGITTGTIDAPRSDGAPNIQVTSWSRTPAQALWLVDKVRSLLDAAVPADMPDGRRVIWLDFPMSSVTVVRDDDNQPALFGAPDRFEMGTA